jgi:hypothetical protein
MGPGPRSAQRGSKPPRFTDERLRLTAPPQERLKLTREKTPLLEAEPPPGKGADVSNWLRSKAPHGANVA